MSLLLQEVDNLVAQHRQRVQEIGQHIADSTRRRDTRRAERDAAKEAKLAELARHRARLAELEGRKHAATTEPFTQASAMDTFETWSAWARHNLNGLTLQDLNLDGHDALLISINVHADIEGERSESRDVTIVVAFDADDNVADTLVEVTSAIGIVVVVPEMRGMVHAPHGMRCAPTHLVIALCALCADTPSTLRHIVGADNVRMLMQELSAAERAFAASVGAAL